MTNINAKKTIHYFVTHSTKSNVLEYLTHHRRSQGVQWVHLHSQCMKKKFRPNLQENCVSAPQPIFKEIFRTVFAG